MGLDVVYQSRHHLRGVIPSHVQWLSQGLPGQDESGESVANKMVVVAGWSPRCAAGSVLSIANLRVALDREDGQPAAAELEPLYSLMHAGTVTALRTADYGVDQTVVVSGSTSGSLHLLQLSLPRTPGAGPEDGDQVGGEPPPPPPGTPCPPPPARPPGAPPARTPPPRRPRPRRRATWRPPWCTRGE